MGRLGIVTDAHLPPDKLNGQGVSIIINNIYYNVANANIREGTLMFFLDQQ
jgi:hypothetical protein